jgi:hypothetical protein
MGKGPSLLSLAAAILGVLTGAGPSGLVNPEAEARMSQVVLRRKEEDDDGQLLLEAPRDEAPLLIAGHRSHSSHSSHSSHYSGSSGHMSHRSHMSHYSSGRGSDYGGGYAPSPAPTPPPAYVPPPPPPPPKPKPALVSFVAYPGGQIFVDGKQVGTDSTGKLKLAAGTHEVRVENKFLGRTTVQVELVDGQTGVVNIEW